MIKKISLALSTIMLLFSSFVDASINRDPQFEFGTVSADKCTVAGPSVTCDIEFQNSYSQPPLVFVMPTIDASRSNFDSKTTEYPSDLKIWSISSSKATIKQLLPPHRAACRYLKYNRKNDKWQCKNTGEKITYVDAPMNDIDYLVMEPGVIKFDSGAMLVAGKVSSKHTFSNKPNGTNNISKQVNFINFGLNTAFSQPPGVLVQIQTRNNMVGSQPLWLNTIALDPTRTGFSLIIDRSEVTKNAVLDQPEEVAFVAGYGEGFTQGRKFWLGNGSTRNTLSALNDNVIKPITEGCKQLSYFPVTGFKSAPVLLASKRTRNGNNGGWLRRCSVTKTSVALINEEDMDRDAERGHVVEPFSYFLFDKPPVDDVCALFPSPVQTWDTNSNAKLEMSNKALISGAKLSNGKRYVGFRQSEITMHNKASCDGLACLGDSGLRVQKQELESFRAPDRDDLKTVDLWHEDREFNNNEVIGTLSVGHGTATFKSGTYWVGTINVNNQGKIVIPAGEKVTIHAKKVYVSNGGSSIGEVDDAELIVLVHDSADSIVQLSQNTVFTGLLYSETNVYLSNSSTVNGAITAKQILMSNGAKIIATDNHCFTPADNFEIDITPISQYALTCGVQQPNFVVTTTNDGAPQSVPVTASVSEGASNFNIQVANGVGSGRYPHFTTSASQETLGKLELVIELRDASKVVLNKEYELTIFVDDDTAKTKTVKFKYVPYMFDTPDLSVIAGKEYQVTTKVLACKESTQTTVSTYTGTPEVTLDLEAPSDGNKDKDSILTYSPSFSSSDAGEKASAFTLRESGKFIVKLTDSNFVCDPNFAEKCPIDEGDGKTTPVVLNGSFAVNARPWTIAACDIQSKEGGVSNPATTDGIEYFIPAAENFTVTYKPIVYSDKAARGETDKCNNSTTTNYYSSTGNSAPLNVAFDVEYPKGGKLANLSEENGFDGKSTFSKSEAKSGKKVEYQWYEVGSLNLTTSADYLGEALEEDSSIIGRFYPKFFKIFTTQWVYPSSQTFIYMNQPFEQVRYDVEALNASEDAISNYAAFSKHAQFNIAQLTDYPGRFVSPAPNSGSWSVIEGKSIGSFTIDDSSTTSCRNASNEVVNTCWLKGTGTKYPDGPFNMLSGSASSIGLVYTGNADPVEFISGKNGAPNSNILTQPKVIFGRVTLTDISGQQEATLSVPYAIEYWNGSRFSVNNLDSATPVKNAIASQNVIWHRDDSNCDIAVSGAGNVKDGEANVAANQVKSPCKSIGRQQSQVWLDVQPWLNFDWDDDDAEEKPSSVLTFGINRGNDRVIYRGEPGLTGGN
ncbi:polymer-forming cytoskeletal protein [Vibrio rotiferianus]|uniref:polymer-forming cytoskeletal protein n=1 Tax=Vibrio rotiferianus TaxID=190895 RepID=UPI0005F05480|nr:polymer-forming cytoskeletal protein [Vibrio rotiferianus]